MNFVPTTFGVEVTGSGRPAIFIPGFACGARVWDETVKNLGDRVQSHVVTLAGFAGRPAVPQPSLANVHAELVRYISDNELDSPVIIGHSLGGAMALWLAETVPGLGGVVNVEGFAFLAGVDDPTMTEARARAEVEPFAAHLRTMTSDQLGAWIRKSMAGMFSRVADRDRVLADCTKSDVATVAQLFLEGKSLDLRSGLPDIAAPVTVVVAVAPEGATDRELTPWRVQTAAIPNLDLVFMTGCHFVMYDQPDEFDAILARVVGSEA